MQHRGGVLGDPVGGRGLGSARNHFMHFNGFFIFLSRTVGILEFYFPVFDKCTSPCIIH
jgi:hypothetical protein